MHLRKYRYGRETNMNAVQGLYRRYEFRKWLLDILCEGTRPTGMFILNFK
jgi:hypothetical protein